MHLYDSGTLNKSRFITGGHQLITNVSYFETPADVTFVGFLMKGIFDTVKAHFRDPEDWGWIGHTLNGMAHSCTIDHKIEKPLLSKKDFLRVSVEECEIQELLSPLKNLSINELYFS